MEHHFYNIVGAERRDGQNCTRVTCPRTGEALWEAPLASKEDLEDAVSSGRASARSWGNASLHIRQNLLRDFALELTAWAKSLSPILARETGKSVSQTKRLCHVGSQRCECSDHLECLDTAQRLRN